MPSTRRRQGLAETARPSARSGREAGRSQARSARTSHSRLSPSWLLVPFIALATFVVYARVLHNDFVAYDDTVYITDNPQVQRGLTAEGLKWALSTFHPYWHPLTWLSHMLDCQLYGMNPGLHHLTSLLIHIASALVLFVVLARATREVGPSGFVAAAFALHPLHVESVAWIAERKDVLSVFFAMLAILAYLRYAEAIRFRPSRGGAAPAHPQSRRTAAPPYLTSLALFVLALMSKPMLVTYPFLLLLLDYWPLGRMAGGRAVAGSSGERLRSLGYEESNHRPAPAEPSARSMEAWRTRAARDWQRFRAILLPLLVEKVPFFVLSLAVSILTFRAQSSIGAVVSSVRLPLESRLANALISYVRYIGKTIWPSRLAVFYPHPVSWPIWEVIAAVALLGMITVGVLLAARSHPYLLTGWLWYLGPLLPVIGLVQAGKQAMADRFMYIPSIGLFMMASWGAVEIARRRRLPRVVLAPAAFTALALLAVTTSQQVRYWRDTASLFTHALSVTSDNFVAQNILGTMLLRQGRPAEAIPHFDEALRIMPSFETHNNLGVALGMQARIAEAIPHFEAALRDKPDYAEARRNLGEALDRQGRTEEAIAQYEAALRLDPGNVEVHNNLGAALAGSGRAAKAIVQYEAAIHLVPGRPDLHNNLGAALGSLGRSREAIQQYREAIRLDPSYVDAHYNLANALLAEGTIDEAIAHLQDALRLRPGDRSIQEALRVAASRRSRSTPVRQ